MGDGTAALAAASPALAGGVTEPLNRSRSARGEVWYRFSRHRLALISTLVLALLVLGVLLGPVLWPIAIDDIDFSAMLQDRPRPIPSEPTISARISWPA